MIRRLARLAPLLVLAASCATLGPPRAVVPFRVEVNVPDATVWVDDQMVGGALALSHAGTFVPAGFHRVEIRHPDYYSFFAEVHPKPGEPVVIRAQLHPLLE